MKPFISHISMDKLSKSVTRTHVVKRKAGWAVKKEGASKASKVYRTKELAVKGAMSTVHSNSVIVVHKADGSIQEWKKVNKK